MLHESPLDFMAILHGQITLARVRRLRYRRYGLPDIRASCAARSWNFGYIGPRDPGPGVRTGTGTDMPRKTG
jgi:hypothetical protein